MYQNIATAFYPQTKDATNDTPKDAPTTPFECNHIFILNL